MIYILLSIGIVLLIAWLVTYKPGMKEKEENENEPAKEVPVDCCGAHEVCEADSLLSSSDNIEYFEDEELDRYEGTPSKSYSEEAIEEFRDVLYTLQEREVASWMKSIQLRKIELPEIIREEALMIVGDRRFSEQSIS